MSSLTQSAEKLLSHTPNPDLADANIVLCEDNETRMLYINDDSIGMNIADHRDLSNSDLLQAFRREVTRLQLERRRAHLRVV